MPASEVHDRQYPPGWRPTPRRAHGCRVLDHARIIPRVARTATLAARCSGRATGRRRRIGERPEQRGLADAARTVHVQHGKRLTLAFQRAAKELDLAGPPDKAPPPRPAQALCDRARRRCHAVIIRSRPGADHPAAAEDMPHGPATVSDTTASEMSSRPDASGAYDGDGAAVAYSAGAMLWLRRKRLSGSYFALTSASRRRLCPNALSTPASSGSSARPVKFR